MLEERYKAVRARGFYIDTRGVYPILIHGCVGTQFPTFEAALSAAERAIG